MAKSAGWKREERYLELKRILEERRRDVLGDVKERIRVARTECAEQRNSNMVRDPSDVAVDDVQEDLEFALIQMKSETLNRINEALRRLDEGTYGNCFECGDEIAEARLKALPFAVRCKDCEEARETAEQRERELARRRGTFLGSSFLNLGP